MRQDTNNESNLSGKQDTNNESNINGKQDTNNESKQSTQIDDIINTRFMESKYKIHRDWFSDYVDDQGSLQCYSMASDRNHCGIFLLMNYFYAFTGTQDFQGKVHFSNNHDFQLHIIEDLKTLQANALKQFQRTHHDSDELKKYKSIMVKRDEEFGIIFKNLWSFELICFVLHTYFPHVVPICIARTPPTEKSSESLFSFSYSQLPNIDQRDKIYILLYLSQSHWYIGEIIVNGKPSIFTKDWSLWYPILKQHVPSIDKTLDIIRPLDNPVYIYAQMLYTMSSDEDEYTSYFF